jgi:hypothetical protein
VLEEGESVPQLKELCRVPASFRDPAGYIVIDGGLCKRVVTSHGRDDYELLMSSGLYSELVKAGLLISHREEDKDVIVAPDVYKLLRPRQLEFISYPYEWSFSELRDAALLTLDVQRRALAHGLSLKDTSAFNVQFHIARPVLIDTLSFEKDNGGPWGAYEQFCRHFLGPLILSANWPQAIQHLKVDLDGFPLEQVSRSLGWQSYLRPGTLLHIHLHARALRLRRNGTYRLNGTSGATNRKAAIVDSLRRVVERLTPPLSSNQEEGPTRENADQEAAKHKKSYVRSVLRGLQPHLVYDFGGRTTDYARLATSEGCRCILYDHDPIRTDAVYREEKASCGNLLLPLVMDLRNPSPALGFGLDERQSLFERPPANLVLALDLLHRLRLRENIPFGRLAGFLARLGRILLVEYAPPEDFAVQRIISRRGSAPDDYSHQGFVAAFSRHFRLCSEASIAGAERRLLLFER